MALSLPTDQELVTSEMASTKSSPPPSPPPLLSPTLLTLPIELRRPIIIGAILATCAQKNLLWFFKSPYPIPVRDLQFDRIPKDMRHEWGHEPMTRLMRVNHQLNFETTDILYASGEFEFQFKETFEGAEMTDHTKPFFDTLGSKKALVRRIRVLCPTMCPVFIHGEWYTISPPWNAKQNIWDMYSGLLLQRMNRLSFWRAELSGLRSVSIEFSLLMMLSQRGLPESGKQRLRDVILQYLRVFEGLDITVLRHMDKIEEEVEILEGCVADIRDCKIKLIEL